MLTTKPKGRHIKRIYGRTVPTTGVELIALIVNGKQYGMPAVHPGNAGFTLAAAGRNRLFSVRSPNVFTWKDVSSH